MQSQTQTQTHTDNSKVCKECKSASCIGQDVYYTQFESSIKNVNTDGKMAFLYGYLLHSGNSCEKASVVRVLESSLTNSSGYDFVNLHREVSKKIVNMVLDDHKASSYRDVRKFIDNLSNNLKLTEEPKCHDPKN